VSKINIEEVEMKGETMYSTVSMLESEEWYRTEVKSERDVTYGQATQTSSELQDFLKRPIKLQRYDWALGTAFDQTILPWSEFFGNARVQEKLANFHLLTCNLVVRIQVNASPFHYGRILASYNPWAVIDGQASDSVVESPGNNGQFLVGRSQRPHVFIETSTNQSGELKLPFFHPNNAFVIQNVSDFTEMGVLNLNSLRDLAAAKPDMGTHPVSITVWAHAEDIVLSVPTTSPAFTPQGDEYDTQGVISKPADTVAGVAGMLTQVPMIGPFARATEIAASGIANIARLFGYSRPVVVDDPMFVRPRNVNSVSNVNSKEAIEKLTLDAKQELTIDPRTAGLSGVDEMSLSHIAQRESLYAIFNWQMADVHEQCLFATMVTPRLEAEQGFAGPPAHGCNHPTAVSFVAKPFKYWSGSLKFRFSFICSRFHRGRVRIVYDPYEAGIATSADNYNVAFSKVIDLAGGRDVTIEIPWMQATPYALTGLSAAQAGASTFRPQWNNNVRPDAGWVTAVNALREYGNGFLAVYVLNELCDAGSNSDVYCAVSVSAGKDFEVGNPTNANFLDDLAFVPQSSVTEIFRPQMDCEDVGEQDPHNVGENAPTHDNMEPVSIADPVVPVLEYKQKIFMGEVVSSFRPLLRRYMLAYYHTSGAALTDSGVRSWRLATMPVWPGSDPNGRDPGPRNKVYMNLFTYVARAYAGYRGSTRRKLLYHEKSDESTNSTITVARSHVAPTYSTAIVNLGVDKDLWNASTPNYWGGSALTCTRTNASLEYELPFYRNKRFAFSRWSNINAGCDRDGSSTESQYIYWYQKAGGSGDGAVIAELFSIGEDFNFFFFLNAPCYWKL
jgi:hypothetical protein